jgi:hypothetical protein
MKVRLGSVALLAVGVAAGCASPAASPAASPTSPAVSAPSSVSPSATSSTSSTGSTRPANPTSAISDLPTIRPSGPPDEPTDQINTKGWVVGTVTTGGSGPCYSLVTDDGTQYALHATDGTKLVRGTRVRVKTRSSRLKIDCGPGRLVEMVAAVPVR